MKVVIKGGNSTSTGWLEKLPVGSALTSNLGNIYIRCKGPAGSDGAVSLGVGHPTFYSLKDFREKYYTPLPSGTVLEVTTE